MTDRVKISELDSLATVDQADQIVVLDVSDTTESPEGTTKRANKSELKGLNWQGTWSAGSYNTDDAVEHNGSAYVATVDTTGEPGVSGDWDLLASKGDTGATGATGATGPAGAVGLTWQGAWSAGTYSENDAVSHNSGSYICVVASTTEEPGVGSDWDILAEPGDITASSVDTLTNKSIDADNNTITNIGLAEFDTDVSDAFKFLIGSALDTPDVGVTSNGTTITLTLEKSGGGDIRYFFSDGVHTHDCTPIASIALTPGSDVSPQMNYIYILQSTKALTVSTTGFPSAEHAPVAEVLCQSAASLQTDEAYKVHVWTDHVVGASDGMGHLSHLNHWIRDQHATWQSGVALTPTVTTNGGSEDNIDIATASGEVYQLHEHDFPAFDTSTGSEVFVVNDNTAAYTKITDLNAADEDDAGNAITNNKYTSLVIWGAVNEDTGQCKLFLNLPSGFYGSEADALADSNRYANYSIPGVFKGVGFLIARLTFKYTTAASGTWVLTENLDLRGTTPTVFAGGNQALSTEFADNAFRLFDEGDETKQVAFQLSGLTTATTRTLTIPDASGTIYISGQNMEDVQEIQLDPTPDTDETATGPTTNLVNSSGALTKFNCLYLDGSGTWSAADASATATADKLLAIALETVGSATAIKVALPGSFIRDDTWAWTPGAPIYLSETTGALTQTAPTTTDAVVRVLGYALTADVMYFLPETGVVHV